jgi:diguanylate cyclase (GGDEF)-like protein/PAS domain S-box-containing protein
MDDWCAREPIHLPNSIQSYGFTVVCEIASAKIVSVSANIGDFLGFSVAELLGARLDRIAQWGSEATQALFAVPLGSPVGIPLKFSRQSDQQPLDFEVVAHRVGNHVIVEAVPDPDPSAAARDSRTFSHLAASISDLQSRLTAAEFLADCARQIQVLTGYDRVLLYQFKPDWSGEVLAEATSNADAHKFLGLHFPASDIPAQARRLYEINLLRVIGDVDAPQSHLIADSTLEPALVVDQSHALLRSVAPVHLQYLRNMDVRATLTISLLKNGKLWGMVACHHNRSKVPPEHIRQSVRSMCEMMAGVLTMRLDSVLELEQAHHRSMMQVELVALARQIRAATSFAGGINQVAPALEDLFKSKHFGLRIGDRWLRKPDLSPLLSRAIDAELALLKRGDILRIDSLRSRHPEIAGHDDQCAGMLATQFGEPGKNAALFFCRSERISEIVWAGEPVKETTVGLDHETSFGPRRSFEKWKERVRGQSHAWVGAEEISIAELSRIATEAYQTELNTQMEDQLKLLATCVARINDMIVITESEPLDLSGPMIVFVNDAFLRITGYGVDDVIGKTPRIMQGPKTDRAQLDRIRYALERWQPVRAELINYTKAGHEFWVEIDITPVMDKQGWYSHWVSVQRDITARKRSESEIQRLAFYDELTRLPNRRMLFDSLARALLIDLDNFKELNDTSGHEFGDRLLRQVSGRISSSVRGGDVVARLGGDEFVVLLEGLGSDASEAATQAQIVSEKILAVLALPFELSPLEYFCTASIGITLFGDALEQMEEILKRADVSMYQAKNAGRNTFRFFDVEMQERMARRSTLVADLRHALAKGEFILQYQPIVELERGVVGAESLIRWQHPNRGMVSPAEFMPLAEETGLILPIGEWVVREVCAQLLDWSRSAETRELSVSINVSARQFREPGFVESITAAINNFEVRSDLVKIELTETMLLTDVEETISKMTALKAAGVGFSLDDFGTGFSSLSYLKRLPIDILKIDRSFVQEVTSSASDASIVRTTIALAKNLGLDVIAEGVETDEQKEFLRDNGCKAFQGYLFAKPMGGSEMGKYLQGAT